MSSRNWVEVLDGALAANEPRPTRRSIAVNYPPALFSLVFEAAKARGMSMGAFQRRAALAVAAHDLGFDWQEAMLAEPPVGRFEGGKPVPSTGYGFGAWRIEQMSDV